MDGEDTFLNSSTRRILLWTFLFSLLFHLIFAIFVHLPSTTPVTPEPPAIEISDFRPKSKDLSKDKQQQLAETEKTDNKEIDPNAKFLSDHNQKVEKQTKASRVDDFKAKQGSGAEQHAALPQTPPTAKEKNKSQQAEIDKDGIPLFPSKKSGVKRDWKTLSMKDLSVSGRGGIAAATDDQLNDVKEGDQTVLSTREFQYYSYYHRIKETLRQYWKPTIERRIAAVWGRGDKLKDGEMITQLMVMLDEQGAIAKIATVTSSGVIDVDDAAVEAFHQASPFPNPPRGIVDPDGLVRIRWDFILKAQAAPAIQFKRAGAGAPMY